MNTLLVLQGKDCAHTNSLFPKQSYEPPSAVLQPVLKKQEDLCILLHGATDASAVTEASPSATGKRAELMEGGSDWKSHFSITVYFLNLILGKFGEDEYTAYEQ